MSMTAKELDEIIAKDKAYELLDVIMKERGVETTLRALECYIRDRPDFYPQS